MISFRRMKLPTTSIHNKPHIWLLMTYLSLVSSLWIPTAAFSNTAGNGQASGNSTELSESTTTSRGQAINDPSSKDYSSSLTHNNKTILNKDSRGLSTFLMIGIIINIVMASLFAWWFSIQWRKTKK